MDFLHANNPKATRCSFGGLFFIAAIILFFEHSNFTPPGLSTFVIWTVSIAGILYLFTGSLKQRLLWWIALTPFGLHGPDCLNINVGVISVIAFMLITEFAVFYAYKARLGSLLFISSAVLPLILIVAVGISICFSPFDTPKPGPFLRFSLLIAVYLIAFLIFNQKEDALLIMKAIGFQVVLYACLLVSHQITEGNFSFFERDRFVGDNITAYTIAISWPFLWMFKIMQRTKLYPLIVILGVIVMILTMSRGGFIILILDAILFVIFYIHKPNKNPMLWMAVFLLFSSIFGTIAYKVYTEKVSDLRDSSNRERTVAAKSAIYGFLKYPLTGIGFGQWINLHDIMEVDSIHTYFEAKTDVVVSRNPHNTFLRIILDTGSLGILAFVLLVMNLGLMSNRLFKRYRSSDVVYHNAYFSLFVVFGNLFIAMLFGDYIESLQVWSVFLAIGIAYKNESAEKRFSPLFGPLRLFPSGQKTN